MPLFSMTGYARAEGSLDACSWSWEAKSVNGKGLDVRVRLPSGFESLEAEVREAAKKWLRRGNLSLSLTIDWRSSDGSYRINRAVLDGYIALLPELARQAPDASPARLDGLLALKGVVEAIDDGLSEDARAELDEALMAGLDEALQALLAMRGQEGARLETVLAGQVGAIDNLCAEASKTAAARPAAIRKKLREQVRALLEDSPSLAADRLEQEAALLMTKADINEEIDRLAAHVSAARDLIAADAAVGRKLDFLCQEFNREANTLCSKSGDVELTRIGLDLKAMIEQFREQVQNIE